MFLVAQSFYDDISSIHQLISEMEFEDGFMCQEIPNLNMVGEHHPAIISSFTNLPTTIHEPLCNFKKYDNIHFDLVDDNFNLVAIIPLEDITVNFFNYKNNSPFYFHIEDPKDFENIPENFTLLNSVTLKANNVIICNPFQFREIHGLVQTIYFKTSNSGDINA